MDNSYEYLDSGDGLKLERFGPYVLSRPCAQAVWKKRLPEKTWQEADATFTREPENRWIKKKGLPAEWSCDVDGLLFKIQPTDFGHLGIFPEQRAQWKWMRETLKKNPKRSALNLFAYSGGATLSSAQGGAELCHLDASKGMVAWARENAALNKLDGAPIRWIIDDVSKFLERELRRGRQYDAIILDPPTFGRGAQGELFKIEEAITDLLKKCVSLLTPKPLFILFSCHTPGFTPIVLENLLKDATGHLKGSMVSGEMLLEGKVGAPLPSGAFARWEYDAT